MPTELNNMYLASGGKLALAFGTSASKIYGSVDADTVTIAAGVTAVLDGSFNRGNDTIQFTGNAASYSIVKVNASTVKITDAQGTSVTIPVGSTGTHIQFADADRVLSGSSAGIVLGDQSVTSTAANLAAGTAPAPVEAYTLSVNAPSVTEGDTGSKTMSYKLTLDKAPTSNVTVNYETLDTGSASANDDFVPVAGSVTFAAGQTVAYVSVNVLGDTILEAPETVKLHLSGSKLVAPVEAIGTIVDNEVAVVDPTSYTVSAGDIATANASNVPVAVNIGDSGSKTVTIQSDGAAATRGVIINGNANATINSGASGDTITVSGNGNNQINTGAGNDTVNVYGSGSNTINVGTGNDTVVGGTGNDTIIFASGGLNADDNVDGGAGYDTVVISGDGNVIDAGNLVGIERIVFNGTTATISASVLKDYIDNGLKVIEASATTTVINVTGLNVPGTLNLSGVEIVGGVKQITSDQSGTIVLSTTQANQIKAIDPTPTSGATITQQVVVAGVQTVAQADALIASGVTAKYVLEDTAANLALASAAVFNNAQSIKATTAATAAQAEAIAAIDALASGFTVSSTNFKVSVTDTAEQLATRTNGLGNANAVSATTAATVLEAAAIRTAAAAGTVTTTLSYAIADTLSGLVNGTGGTLLTGAKSVSVIDTVTNLADLKSVNDAIGTANDGKNVVAGYKVSAGFNDLTGATYAAEVAAAGDIIVNGALQVSQANAIEALNNTGNNTYTLNDSTVSLLAASPSVVANAVALGAVTANDTAVNVSAMNALVSKYGNTALTYSGKVVDTATEIVKLTSSAISELGAAKIEVTGTSTATVNELLALNNFLTGANGSRISQAPAANTVKVRDTAASLESAVKVADTLTALDASASVEVSTAATVKQIADINAKLAGSVVNGYTLQDSAANLVTAGQTTIDIVDNASKVTVTGTVTLDQIDTIVDRYYTNGSFAAADLGSKVIYSIRDTAAGVLTALNSGGNGGVLSEYRVGASSISITNSAVDIATAKNLIALKATTKFDGVYAISTGVSALNTGYADTTAGGDREALLSATKVTLIDSVAALSDAAGETARGRATATIASDTLSNLTSASSALKAAVTGFSIDGSVSVTDVNAVSAVNALAALKPTTYAIASDTYANLIAGNSTFLANASTVSVSDDLTVAKAANLISKTGATASYNIVDTAANIANASASVLAGDLTPQISAAANAKVVTVAQAIILEGLGVTGYTISDTAGAISSAPLAVLQRADHNAGADNDGQGVVINDGTYAALTVDKATAVFGTSGVATAKYDLVDTATNLSSANSSLVGFARNVTATSAATPQEAAAIASKEPKGTVTYDVTGGAADLVTYIAGTNGARNVTVTSAGANLTQAKQLIDATNSGTLTYKLVNAGTDLAADLLSTNAATKAGVLAAIDGATTVVASGTVNGAEATALASVDKAISYSISDSATNLSAATVSTAALNEAVNITVTGAAKATFAATVLGASNTGTVTFLDTANGGVTGTSAELAALKLATGDVIAKVTATNLSTVAEAKVISGLSGTAVYGLTDTAANLASAAQSLRDGATLTSSGYNIIATTAATAAQAIVLEAASGSAKYQIADTYSNLMANSDVLNDVDADAAMTSATKVTVTDGAITLAQAQALVAVDGSVSKYVYSVTDRDAAIAGALSNDASLSTIENILLNASSVTGENGVTLALKVLGSNVYVTGTKAELAALSPEFKSSSVAKLVVADVAALNADPLYYSALPTGTSLRVEDSFSNLNSGNALVRTAASVVVKGAVSVSDAAVVNGWTATQKVYDLADSVDNLATASSTVLNGAANIVASGTANFAQAQAIVDATGATSVTIAAASMNASDAVTMTYGSGDKISTLTVTGTADMTQAGAIRSDILGGNVGSATYSISDVGTAVATDTPAAAALRNGATNITATGQVSTSQAQLILSATNVSGKTTVASVAGTPAEVAKLVADSNDTITQITVNGDNTNVATVAQALAIAALDARTGTTVTYNFKIVDTAEAILAAPLSLLDAVNSVTVKGAVGVQTASQLLALDTADTTIDVSLEIKDSISALKAAPLAVATSSGVTKVTVDGVAKVADITAIDTAFTNVTVGSGLVYELNDRYTALGANTAVSNGASNVTVDGAISVGQASIVFGWAGTATYTISASSMSVAAAYNAAHVQAATSVTLTGSALVSEAKSLSEMTNLSGGYTIKDAAAAIFSAYNAINGSNASDYETIIGAKSVSLSDDASVAQLVGNGTQNGISTLLSGYTIYDDGDAIAAALANPTNAALVENASQVALKTDLVGMKVDSYVAITSEYGTRFIGYDSDRSSTQVEGTYRIADTATNVLIADEAIIARAASVTVNGTSSSDTIDLSSLARGVIVNAGVGADLVTGTTAADQFNIAAGDTVLTVSQGTALTNSSVAGFDRITNFSKADGTATSELLNVEGTASIVGNGTVDSADVILNNSGTPWNFKSFVVTDGVAVFYEDDAATGGSNINLDLTNVAGAVATLQGRDLGDAGATVAFRGDFDSDGQFDDVGVFTQGSATGSDNSLDTLVFLLNTGTVTSLVTANTNTANALFIG